MSRIKRIFQELPGWIFDLDEISAGVYKARGVDESGRSVELSGTDPDLLIGECKKSALKMRDDVQKRVRNP